MQSSLEPGEGGTETRPRSVPPVLPSGRNERKKDVAPSVRATLERMWRGGWLGCLSLCSVCANSGDWGALFSFDQAADGFLPFRQGSWLWCKTPFERASNL